MKKILVIGGSGYIGRVLIDDLVNTKNHVTNVDLKIYPDQQINLRNEEKRENFIKLDLRNTKELKKQLELTDSVIILAGLVGEYITNKYLNLSNSINDKGIISLIDECGNHNNIKNVIFVSTCSNYGITKNQDLVNEEHELKPLSPYAKAKVKIEKYLLNKKSQTYSPTILRFATAFGYSPRMRFDLTINHFCYSMLKDKAIEVYDPNTWRPYCHVKDFSRLIIKILSSDREKIDKKVFNAGSDVNNFSKKAIVDLILKKLPNTKIILKKGGVDKRDYRVSFDKIKKELNFETKYSVEDGIEEILNILKDDKMNFLNENTTKTRGNFEILNHVK
jgi:nucleoside-diphosphate-sugar epimerase